MSNQPIKLRKRYPGLRPFDRTQSALFYGRNVDVQRLSNLVLRERLTVLFSKSGIGKTSLLQAGVSPILENKGFVPIFLRADKTGSSIVDEVKNVLNSHPQAFPSGGGDQEDNAHAGLWETIKRLDFDINGLPATPVLVFDQFEELFTLGHAPVHRDYFIDNLADLINEGMPEIIREHLLKRVQDGDEKLNSKVMDWWEAEPDFRVIISIRSDFLHLLDEISPKIPGILRNRFQLQPLDKRQAQEAIESPAKAAGAYASSNFSYSEEALTEMVDFLAGDSGDGDTGSSVRYREEIESFNLQILCRFIEEKIIDENQPKDFIVTPDFYGGWEGMGREIREFYTRQLNTLPLSYTRRTGNPVDDPEDLIHTAKMVIEESLVTPIGRRCSMVDDFLTTTWNVSTEFLDTLVESRLLRKELRLDDYYYEITHDTLLPAIIESRDLRRKQEKADEERKRLQDQLDKEAERRREIEKELETVREKRRLARKVGILSTISLVLALAFGIWFMWQWVGSLREDFKLAEDNFSEEFFDSALSSYENIADNKLKCTALRMLDGIEVGDRVIEADSFRVQYQIVTSYMEAGDSLFFLKDYANALDAYRLAEKSLREYEAMNYQLPQRSKYTSSWRINPAKIRAQSATLALRIESNRNTLIDQFKISQRDAETFIEARVWGQALRNLHEMKALLPSNESDQEALRKALNLVSLTPQEYVDMEISRCKSELFYN